MFRPPFFARVAAGAAVYALEETRRLPTAAVNFPITAISQLLQTTMHAQQFVTSLALKGDAVFDRLANRPVEQPEWATFDEDLEPEQTFGSPADPAHMSRFDMFSEPEPEPEREPEPEPAPSESVTVATASTNGSGGSVEVIEPEVATRYDYTNMTLAQLRARLRMLSVEDLTALLAYEQQTRDRAPFVTMLTNRIATVRAQ
ncbi:lipid droplet-associated protein [Nocardia wallacei]|uniref:lipid droplet-associated protein n=1 Tax=Nocardia wallacei TaxID=480035 RepID=UPI00245664E8|nr:lipid droplet-associated protein [Nocardia wallacei]